MSNTIQQGYGASAYSVPTKACEVKQAKAQAGAQTGIQTGAQTKTQANSFPGMAAAACGGSAAPAASSKSDMTMEAYQQAIREEISRMPLSATRQMESISIQISEAAFERMKNDPEYEAWVLNDLKVALSQTNPWVPITGGGYSVFYIGGTKEECHAEGWYPGCKNGQGAAIFEEKAKGSFWAQRMENHKKNMELQKEAAARHRLLMKIQMNDGSVSAAELLAGLF